MNVKSRSELVTNLAQQCLALRGAHVGDADVARQRMGIAANAPHVEVVDIIDAWDGADCAFNALQFHAAGSAFEQDVEALADDSDGRPQDHHANAYGQGGINPA